MHEVAALNVFIKTLQDVREVKRALTVKLGQQGYRPSEVSRILDVSASYVTKWNKVYQEQGLAGLRLAYKGSKGYLTPAQRQTVLEWLQAQTHWEVDTLRAHIEERYGVVYKSRQSYYDLCKAAGLSQKKSQKSNPQQDPEQIVQKRQALDQQVQQWAAELQTGQRVLFFQDECHLRWGDSCGYVWGPKGQRIEIPITNEKQKQTYYGVLNYLTAEVLLEAYPAGNSDATIAFLEFLVAKHPQQRISLIWDGARYHTSKQLQAYLAEVNRELPPAQWKITCFLLAPYAPEQNPMEDVWLHGKSYVRQHYYQCKTFKDVKELFVDQLQQTVLDFPKLQDYRRTSQIN